MELRLAVLKSVFNTYNTNAYPLVFFFVVMFFLIIRNKKEQINLLIYGIFGILLLVTPFIGNKILTIGNASGSNWTMYGILCSIPLTAYGAVQIMEMAKNKKEKWMLLLVIIVVLHFGMGLSVAGEYFCLPGEEQKISKVASLIYEKIEIEEETYVMLPFELAGDLRECSNEIKVFRNESYDELQKNLELLQTEAEYYGCNYVVLDLKYDNEEQMTENGFTDRVCVDAYVIYRKCF